MCKTDSSWIVEHKNNDEHVFVTTVDWTVARLSAITVNPHRPMIFTPTLETIGNLYTNTELQTFNLSLSHLIESLIKVEKKKSKRLIFDKLLFSNYKR